MDNLKFSICTTNYNCAHALRQHLDSLYSLFDKDEFEYIIVDGKSRDGSMEILSKYEENHGNMVILSLKCSIGRGRQIAFEQSRGDHIVVVDTDTVYIPRCRDFIEICLGEYPDTAVQAIYCGVYPRKVWKDSGGRRDMNVKEDVDAWMRIWKLGKMKFYPVSMGKNVKESDKTAYSDHLSKRYGKSEKFRRLIRREIDLLKARWYEKYDFLKVYNENIIDLGLGPHEEWFWEVQHPPWPVKITRDVVKILKS
ncbi:MAG: glycosyltransferase family 2 protein [Thermoplasmata archaeon]|nr:MAG: glycosyltransferase family 2 protein [Thermoplasmata archaeon]